MDDLIESAAKACGSAAKLAEILGESQQTISNWRTRGVPLGRCADLEKASGFKVRRWHLRPDDWHRIWPELIGAEGAPAVPTPATTSEGA